MCSANHVYRYVILRTDNFPSCLPWFCFVKIFYFQENGKFLEKYMFYFESPIYKTTRFLKNLKRWMYSILSKEKFGVSDFTHIDYFAHSKRKYLHVIISPTVCYTNEHHVVPIKAFNFPRHRNTYRSTFYRWRDFHVNRVKTFVDGARFL